MELEELCKETNKAFEDGNINGVLLIISSNNNARCILTGNKLDVIATLISSMYLNKELENTIKFCVKRFSSYEKEMNKNKK